MEKNEFWELFKELTDSLPVSKDDLAQKFKVTKGLVTRWYNGSAAPATMARDTIIKRLYADQQKQEQAAFIKKVIKDNLTINIKEPSYYYDHSYTIELMFDGEVFATTYFDVEKCKCNDSGCGCC